MPDPDTQKAINETLRNVRSRLNDQFEKVRRGRKGDATEAPIRSERMATYTRAMRVVSQFIRPVADTDYPNE